MAVRAITRNFRISNVKVAGEMSPVRSFATSIVADVVQHPPRTRISGSWKADLAPIYILGGLLVVASTIGAHTAKQQLMHSPAVHISKKRREGSPDVDDPDSVIREADKFLNKSILRKFGHIQASHSDQFGNPVHANPYTKSREVETLRSVGA